MQEVLAMPEVKVQAGTGAKVDNMRLILPACGVEAVEQEELGRVQREMLGLLETRELRLQFFVLVLLVVQREMLVQAGLLVILEMMELVVLIVTLRREP
tara:strand:+ start:155 stop:451 length:297 start_codon:yes stop_codon:yes gene_type:complete